MSKDAAILCDPPEPRLLWIISNKFFVRCLGGCCCRVNWWVFKCFYSWDCCHTNTLTNIQLKVPSFCCQQAISVMNKISRSHKLLIDIFGQNAILYQTIFHCRANEVKNHSFLRQTNETAFSNSEWSLSCEPALAIQILFDDDCAIAHKTHRNERIRTQTTSNKYNAIFI